MTFHSNGTERLRITSSGEVKIMNTSGTVGLYFQSSSGAVSNFRAIGTNNQSLGYFFGNSEKVRFDSSGRVLIGTTTEGNAGSDDLTIATSGSTGITVRSGTSGNGNLYFSDGTSGDDEYRGSIQYQHANNALIFATDAVERLRINSSGKVMLGTSTPSSNSAAYMFTVADPTNSLGNCGITIRAGTGGGSNTNQGSIFYSNATSGTGEYAGYLQYNHNDNWFRIGTNSAERFRITSNGKIGVGVDPTNYPGKFVVSGDALICDRDIHSRVANSVANSDSGFKLDIDGTEKLHL